MTDEELYKTEEYQLIMDCIQGVDYSESARRIIKMREESEKKGREYSIAQQLNQYMSGEHVDVLTLVQGFANIFIAAMCVDTNADSAEIKLTDLSIKGQNVGTWKVTAKKVKK